MSSLHLCSIIYLYIYIYVWERYYADQGEHLVFTVLKEIDTRCTMKKQRVACMSAWTPSRRLLLLMRAYGETSLQDHLLQVGVGPLRVDASFKVRRQGLGHASDSTQCRLVGALRRQQGRDEKLV